MKPLFHQTVRMFGVCVTLWWSVARMAGVEIAPPEPELSISLRGVGSGTIEVGEPFRVAVRLDAPAESPAKLVLAPADGSWIEAITVNIISADGSIVPAQARSAITTGDRETIIDADHTANGLWWFASDSLRSLTPGDYRVRAKLVIRDGTGWKGEVVSEPAELRVVAISKDFERVTQRTLALAQAAILDGAPEKAANILDVVLEASPDNVPVLGLRAALCLEGGNRSGASGCIDRALMLDAHAGGKPSAALHALADRIAKVPNENAAATAIPAWAVPPRSVFGPITTIGGTNSAAEISAQAVQVPSTPATTALPKGAGNASIPKPTIAPTIVLPAGSGRSIGSVIVPSAELIDAKIIADVMGQWAVTATASSQYGQAKYAPAQATGAPNIALGMAGDNPDAWCPLNKNNGTEWIEVGFAKLLHATEVRVRQNNAPGAIVKIEAIEPDGTVHIWWEGVDPFVAPAVREIAWFAVRVPQTSYSVAKVKITLNLAAVPGWKQIDAVQLVGVAP